MRFHVWTQIVGVFFYDEANFEEIHLTRSKIDSTTDKNKTGVDVSDLEIK